MIIKKLRIMSLLTFGLLMTGCGNSDKNTATEEFLPVEKAFVFSIKASDDKTIRAHWDIAKGYHLYKDKFEFALENEDYQIASLNMPKGKMILDKVFGDKESYEGAVDVNISLKAINDSGKVIMNTRYQGCSEKGLCYPPQTVQTEINLAGS